MGMTSATAPTHEIGYVTPSYGSTNTWWMYDGETTPELRWPQSVEVYDAMRTQDAQVGSVLEAVTRPILRTPWRISPAGARDEVVKFVADELGLPIVGQNPEPPARSKDRFSWVEHLELALLMLPFGHMYFEQVYRVDDNGDRAHLRKLAPRMPRTIQEIKVARDGGLISITQLGTMDQRGTQKPIPVNRLVAYIYKREGGNWLGRSVLRQAYKNWLLKDRLLRVQAQTIERNGMGIPLYTAQEGASQADLDKGLAMAKGWRSGESAGTAVPNGATLTLVGVSGQLPDAGPAVKYHDEQIARAVLAHFLNLDTQSHGSYALGTTFADFFTLSLQTTAQQVADTATSHVVEDLVDINFGEDEPAPRLVFDEIGSRQAATAQAISSLVAAGVIQPDEVLEESSRQQYGLPPKAPESARNPDGTPINGPDAGAAAAPPPPDNQEWVAASADPDADVDMGAALIVALAEFCGEVHASAGPDFESKHPRGAGGRFRNVIGRIMRALEDWSRGTGPDDPLPESQFTREHVREAAKVRGIKLKPGIKREDIVDALLNDVREKTRTQREAPNPSAKFTLQGPDHRDLDVAVYKDPQGRPALYREGDSGKRGALVAKFDSLAGLQAWADEHGEPRLAEWARKESGAKTPAISGIAAAIRDGGGEGEIVRLLDADVTLTPERLRELAADLGIEVPANARTRQRLQSHIAAEASRMFGPGDGRLSERAPTPPRVSQFDPRDKAEQMSAPGLGGDIGAVQQRIVDELQDVTSVADLRRVATAVNLPLPRDRKFTPEELRLYIAERVVGDRTRWALHGTDPRKATTPRKVAPKSGSASLADLKALGDKEAVRDALDLRTVDALKTMLGAEGLPKSGRKRELVDRLTDHIAGGPASPSPRGAAGKGVPAARPRKSFMDVGPDRGASSGDPDGKMYKADARLEKAQSVDDLHAALDGLTLTEAKSVGAGRGVDLQGVRSLAEAKQRIVAHEFDPSTMTGALDTPARRTPKSTKAPAPTPPRPGPTSVRSPAEKIAAIRLAMTRQEATDILGNASQAELDAIAHEAGEQLWLPAVARTVADRRREAINTLVGRKMDSEATRYSGFTPTQILQTGNRQVLVGMLDDPGQLRRLGLTREQVQARIAEGDALPRREGGILPAVPIADLQRPRPLPNPDALADPYYDTPALERPDNIRTRVHSIRHVPTAADEEPGSRVSQAQDQIRAAVDRVRQQTGRGPDGWVGLAELRQELPPEFTREEVDKALILLNRSPDARIIPESNQIVLSQRDWDASVIIGNQHRFAISITPDSPAAGSGLGSLSDSDLRARAMAAGIVGFDGMSREELLAALRGRGISTGSAPATTSPAADKMARAKVPKVDIPGVAAALRGGGSEIEVATLLDRDPSLTPARLKELAAELGIDVPAAVKSRADLQLLLGQAVSRQFGPGDGTLLSRVPEPPRAFDAHDAARRAVGGLDEAAIVQSLADVTTAAKLRQVAKLLSIVIPASIKDRDELRLRIAQLIIRDRGRYAWR